MKTSSTITAIAPALVKAIGGIKSVHKDGKNPFLKNKYATLDNIIEACKPVLLENGLCVFQPVSESGVETIIMHSSGEWIATEYAVIPAEISKGLSAAQARGVAITYMKRYQLGSMLGISTDDDTDGQYGDNAGLKPEKPAEPEKPKGPVQMTETVFRKFIVRMNSGEQGLPEKIRAAFVLNSEQDRELKMFENDNAKMSQK